FYTLCDMKIGFSWSRTITKYLALLGSDSLVYKAKTNHIAETVEKMDNNLTSLHNKYCIVTQNYDTKTLVNKFPPKIWSANKKVLFSISMSGEHKGTIKFSKYSPFPSQTLFQKIQQPKQFIKKMFFHTQNHHPIQLSGTSTLQMNIYLDTMVVVYSHKMK